MAYIDCSITAARPPPPSTFAVILYRLQLFGSLGSPGLQVNVSPKYSTKYFGVIAKVPEPTVVALLQDVKVVSVHLGVLLDAGAAHVIKLLTVAHPDVGCGFSLSIKSSMAFNVDSVA